MSIRDILAKTAGPPTPNQAYNFLVSCCSKKVSIHAYGGANEGYEQGLKPTECTSIDALLSQLQTKIRLSDAARDAFKVMFAVAISLEVSGPFLWMHITGPSSSLKTTILELLGSAHDKVFSITEFKSFYSGSTVNGRDNSLLPQIQGKLFIIKDLTPLLQKTKQEQDAIFPQFRDIYDGTGGKFFNNGVSLNYTGVRFVCLTGVTYIIHSFSRTDMGERFLICDINSTWTEHGEFQRMATELNAEGNAYDSIFDTIADGFAEDDVPRLDKLDAERSACWGLLNHLLAYMVDEKHGYRALALKFKADRTIKLEIDSLSEWMENARCKVGKEDDSVAPEPALPHRTVKQLGKLAICLAIVTQSDGPTDEIRRLLRKVTFDTARSKSLQIMNIVATHPMISKDLLASRLSISSTWVNAICNHLVSMGVVERRSKTNSTEGPGRHSLCYCLTPKFRAIADCIGLKEISIAAPTYAPQSIVERRMPSVFGRKK